MFNLKKRDFILIAIILAMAITLFGVYLIVNNEEGAYVVVRVNGEEVAKFSLNKNGEYSLNGGTNILRIEDGKAYLIYANCPDHRCVKKGKIYKSNQTITCLPNKLTVTVYGAEESVDLVLE